MPKSIFSRPNSCFGWTKQSRLWLDPTRRRAADWSHSARIVENPWRKLTEVSLERLMRFLTALGCHIEIKIGAGQENKAGDVTIKDVRRTAA